MSDPRKRDFREILNLKGNFIGLDIITSGL